MIRWSVISVASVVSVAACYLMALREMIIMLVGDKCSVREMIRWSVVSVA